MPDLWDASHPVLDVVRNRREAGSKPGHRDAGDTAKVGLAVEGGGMRGVISAAMLACLEDRGLADAFDAVYGISSGAINAAYFLTDNVWYPTSIYFDDLTTGEFISYRRALLGGSLLSLDYAYNVVVERVKPLRYEMVLSSPVPLTIGITLVDEVRTLAATGFTSRADLKSALTASSWLPVAIRGTATYRGQRAIDGGVLTALPFRLALADGCTHVLSLSTKPMAHVRGTSAPASAYTAWHLNRLRPGLGDGYLKALSQKQADRRSLAAMRLAGGPHGNGAAILDLGPLPGLPSASRTTGSPHRLLRAARNAYAVTYAAIEGLSSDDVLSGGVQAIPRFSIAERDNGSTYPRFADHLGPRSGQRQPGQTTAAP